MAIINSACEGCPLQRYTVTSNCQNCMAEKCMEACHFDAIIMTHQGAVINPDKCRECGMCAQACPYNAISDARRPCVRSCPVDAISVDKKNRLASIDYSKCISCGACTVACPFSAISDTSMMVPMIDDIRDRTVRMLLSARPKEQPMVRREVARQLTEGFEGGKMPQKQPTSAAKSTKVGRNDPCPCGSGKKYKK